MKLEIKKNFAIELIDIMMLQTFNCNIEKNNLENYNLEMNISYKDKNNHECFKTETKEIVFESLTAKLLEVKLLNSNAFIIENNGLLVEATFEVTFEDDLLEVKKEFSDIEDGFNRINENLSMVNNHLEGNSETQSKKENNDNISDASTTEVKNEISNNNLIEDEIIDSNNSNSLEEIKDEIKEEYQNNMVDSLNDRTLDNDTIKDNVIVTTNSKISELDFIKFFDNEIASYYKIITLSCKENELNDIAKKYNISYNELLKGFDSKNGKVIFKYKG